MKLETQRFFNLEKFKWKCAEALKIDEAQVTDKTFANWLGVAPKYYSNWKNQQKFMNSVSARKFEKRLAIPQFTLDVLHINDDIFSDFLLECVLIIRQYITDNSLQIESQKEIMLIKQLFDEGKVNGLRFNHKLLRQLARSL